MAWRFGWSAELPAYLAFGAVAATVTVTDLAARRIPNRVVAPACTSPAWCSWFRPRPGPGRGGRSLAPASALRCSPASTSPLVWPSPPAWGSAT